MREEEGRRGEGRGEGGRGGDGRGGFVFKLYMNGSESHSAVEQNR